MTQDTETRTKPRKTPLTQQEKQARASFWLEKLLYTVGTLVVVGVIAIIVYMNVVGTHHRHMIKMECTTKGGMMMTVNAKDVCMKPGETIELDRPEWLE